MSYKFTEAQAEDVILCMARLLLEYCIKHGIHHLFVGASGGLDSSVTLGVAARACALGAERGYALTVVGVTMDCESDPNAKRLGMAAIQAAGAEHIHMNLTPIFRYSKWWMEAQGVDVQLQDILKRTHGEYALKRWDDSMRVALGNWKARLRMMYGVYDLARKALGMVLSTDNLSEWWMAFWTICGDVGDFGPIQDVSKGYEMPMLARVLGVPQEIIDAQPDDGNKVAEGGDAAQLGGDYPTVDRVMIRLIQQGFDPDGSMDQLDSIAEVEGVDPETVLQMATRCLRGAYKRRGTVRLTREQLGLPDLMQIKL